MLDRSDEEMRLNKGHIVRLWFRVDREAKLFKTLSYDFCDKGSCTDSIMAERYEARGKDNKTVKMGKWDVKIDANKFNADEYSLNALNTVMRSINFCREGVNILNAGDDIGDNMTFYFPKPIPTTSVCAGLVPTPPRQHCRADRASYALLFGPRGSVPERNRQGPAAGVLHRQVRDDQQGRDAAREVQRRGHHPAAVADHQG